MTDIYLNEPTLLRTKRRAARIEIQNPYNPASAEKSISYIQEDVQVDANGNYLTSAPAPVLYFPVDQIITTTYEVVDPVTGQTVTISGAAIALWLEQDYVVRATAALQP